MRPSAICFLLNVLNSHAGGMAVARPYGFEIDFEIDLEEIRDKISRSQRRRNLISASVGVKKTFIILDNSSAM